MNNNTYSLLQVREVFHIEFLRFFGKKVKASVYTLKGGVNLRLFFKSVRYSEDMDLDVSGIQAHVLKDTVMNILKTNSFVHSLKTFGIESVIPPDIAKAKQTQTTQRFKIHLITSRGEDLFTKIEFSRRGTSGNAIVEPADAEVLRAYKSSPLIVPHYDTNSAILQKIGALANRAVIQARDVFDLHVLSSQFAKGSVKGQEIDIHVAKKAYDNLFTISFEQFKDAVVGYLSHEDQGVYSTPSVWDEIKLKTAKFIEEDICKTSLS
ncbi:MAG: nucleotidyl transferase AbiEii/AbiGii toxin family protein [Elusimicrobia bacterium]|nr:nucleotidyl transferase AbiEii/AbiGii toxin family protein [Candidatus Liberimonas magnetica]